MSRTIKTTENITKETLSQTQTSITTSNKHGGVICGMCGNKMYHDPMYDMWRCPNCHDNQSNFYQEIYTTAQGYITT